jgi:hypothetical protein
MNEEIQYWFRVLGLIIDIIGAFIIFKNGLPFDPKILDSYAEIEILESEKPKLLKQKKLAYIGLGLLMLGFILQLLGNV